VIVFLRIGSSAYSIRATIAGRASVPPISGSGIRNPSIARLGMVWVMLAIASANRAARGRRAHAIPSGTPSAAATASDTPTRNRWRAVCAASSPALATK
jgi:hypothetical protein